LSTWSTEPPARTTGVHLTVQNGTQRVKNRHTYQLLSRVGLI